ncbi:molybdopterin molybdenumtransferase MoeA [Acidianus sulfidivorans JP7]|uniref:Molybdopterin molybdenumtransferase MoeA n=1 Tax=Acidianus sulfidivorans JP7 TaxID=619593 RepID=A0A2U9IKY4_9CREN|nr:molybdopterin-binding protein [Acidianus sulfidivorans]AWR96671.1 molybdopterin molybdenumtransferase MoeA [Acidianus sulfidivorans JP7]
MRAILPEDNLLTYKEALSLLIKEKPLSFQTQEVNLFEALNKIVAEDIYSNIDLPPFSRSTVDGFAIKSSNTPGKFKIKGKINIGEFTNLKIENDETIEVDTGAMLPEDADAVVKIEDTQIEGDYVVIKDKIPFGKNVAWIGSDIPRGFQIVRKGEKLTPEKIAFLASAGISKVKIYNLPSVYLIITGDELIKPGEKLEPGKIYESNLYYLYSRLTQDGIKVVGYEVVKDNKDEIESALERGSKKADVIITTGGTSAGEKDFIHQIIREKGKILIHGIKFKPGKPTLFGEFNGKTVIGLPGNIVSSIMVYDRVVSKYLTPTENNNDITISLKMLIDVFADKKRFTYLPVYIVNGYAIPIPFDSYMIGSFSSADGFIGLEPGSKVKEEEKVNVVVKNNSINYPTIIGEEDKRFYNLPFKKIFLGSYIGCKALEKNIGDVVVVSSLYCTPEKYDYVIERNIVVNGSEHENEIGYSDWLGISKIIKNPQVKLKSPSTAINFIGKARVYAPENYIDGTPIGKEKLYVIILNKDVKDKLLPEIF